MLLQTISEIKNVKKTIKNYISELADDLSPKNKSPIKQPFQDCPSNK